MYVINISELNITILSTATIIVMIVTLHTSRTKMTKLLDRMFRKKIYIYNGGNIMKLNEFAKKMNDKFNNGQLDIDNMDFTNALDDIDMTIPYTDDNDLSYLDYIQQELDMMADMDDDEMIYSTGHFDEQLLDNYWSAQDEDGNYIHQIDVEIN